MNDLYHGSAAKGIRTLEAGSLLHGTQQRVVYLTDNLAYALFYLWDEAHVGWPQKHVTAWVEAGLAQYEEQFAGQLEAFYRGASGWLYRVEPGPLARPVEGREGMFYVPEGTAVAEARIIPDVYEALAEQERLGRLKVWRFAQRTPQEREELTWRVARHLAANGLFEGRQVAGFFQRYFPEAWEQALRLDRP